MELHDSKTSGREIKSGARGRKSDEGQAKPATTTATTIPRGITIQFRKTYHVGLGFTVMLALETARRSFIRRGTKVGRERLVGHCVE